MEEKKEKQKKKHPLWLVIIVRALEILFGLLIMAVLIVFIAVGAFSYNMKGSIRVSVNGEIVEPQNIVCYRGSGDRETQKTKLHWKEEYYFIKAKADSYDGYNFEFDVDTEDGTKHFHFRVFKTHNGSPTVNFDYELKLCMEDGEWVAYVSLGDEYGTKPERILLKDDPEAFISIGP